MVNAVFWIQMKSDVLAYCQKVTEMQRNKLSNVSKYTFEEYKDSHNQVSFEKFQES